MGYVVLPRVGTISPWSSKATDILHISGLTQVERVERGVRWYVGEEYNVGQLDPSFLFDRMTQEVFMSAKDIDLVGANLKRKPLINIDISKSAKDSLNRANHDLGLALSEEEINYLDHFYSSVLRNPTDAELMMFAQANSEHCRHKIFLSLIHI